MKIFLFSISDGLGVYSVQLARGLAAKDQVTIALHGPEADELLTEFPDFFQESQFHPLAVPHYGFPDPRKIWQAFRVHRAITRYNPDVLHVHLGGLFTEAFPVLWLAHQSGLPMVATVHDPWYHLGDLPPLRHAWLICKVQEWCSQLIVHGRQLAQDLVNGLGMDERLVSIVPHGNHDLYLQAKGSPPPSEPVPGRVLFFGRMLKYKGLDVLAQAAERVAAKVPALKIVLAGRGEELDRFESQLRSIPYFEIHKQWVQGREVARFYYSASLVVVPYIEATQSGPLHLAFTFGRPVVATRVGAIPESVENGREGLLVPPNDPKALAEAMIQVLNNPELAGQLGRAARRKAETDLNWGGEIGEKTRAVYHKAMELKKNGVTYPGIGFKARWERVKEYYRLQKQNEARR